MPYDRDSFLAGLAVGRTLWKPPKIDEGFSASVRSVPAESESEQEEQEQEEDAV